MPIVSRIRRRRGALVAALLALAVLAFDAPAVPCEVLLNEILAGPTRDWDGNGAVSSRDDEWVEIANVGSSSVDLSGFLLSDADSTIRFRFQGTLAAGQRALVFGAEAVAWQRDHGASVAGLSLNNSGDTVRLWRELAGDTVQVDAYAYESHETTGDRASGRQPDGGPWALFDGLNPYSGSKEPTGNGCEPTPGIPNECGATPSEARSWGLIKSTYR